MTMSSQKSLRDLLTASYSMINDLNGLVKLRTLEETLQQNKLKAKDKARNLFKNLHRLLDSFYVQLIKSLHHTVDDVSGTLKQHSDEIEDYVTYMAQVCLIAETVVKKDNYDAMEGTTISDKLSECLSDGKTFKNIDYAACVSVDLDVDIKSLFGLPFINIVSHRSDDSQVTKLQSLKLDDLGLQSYDPFVSKDSLGAKAKTETKNHLNQSATSTPEASSLNAEKSPLSPQISVQKEPTLPDNVLPSNRVLKELCNSMHTTSVNVKAAQVKVGKPESFARSSATQMKNGNIGEDIIKSTTGKLLNAPILENSKLEKKQDKVKCDTSITRNYPVSASYDVTTTQWSERTPLHSSPRKTQEIAHAEELSMRAMLNSLNYNDRCLFPTQSVAREIPNRLQEILKLTKSAPLTRQASLPQENQPVTIHDSNLSTSMADGLVDRNLSLLQSCFDNAQQSLTTLIFPHTHHRHA